MAGVSYQLVTCPQCHREAGVITVRMNGIAAKHIEVHTRRDGTGQMCLGTGRRIEDASSDLLAASGPSVESADTGTGAVPPVPLSPQVQDVTDRWFPDFGSGLAR